MPEAAVFNEVNEPLTIEDIYVDDPGPYEVLVKTMATGVCHSDLHFVEGLYMRERGSSRKSASLSKMLLLATM